MIPHRASVLKAIDDLIQGNSAVTGDEFTLLVSVEIMRHFSPSLLVITFSDMEVAHFGSYSMHLAGIRMVDRLVFELWNEVQTQPSYRGRTTLFILPEFGRDMDGSATNGFFNHRQDRDSTRLTWMMCLGKGAKPGTAAERPVRHVDLCPTVLQAFAIRSRAIDGHGLAEIEL